MTRNNMVWQRRWEMLVAREKAAVANAERCERELSMAEAPNHRLESRFKAAWEKAVVAEEMRVSFEEQRFGAAARV